MISPEQVSVETKNLHAADRDGVDEVRTKIIFGHTPIDERLPVGRQVGRGYLLFANYKSIVFDFDKN